MAWEENNWGRWGDDDQLGTLNFIDGEVVARALKAVRTGRMVDLSIPIRSTKVPHWPDRLPPIHFMTLDGGDYAIGARRPGGLQITDDYIFLACHGTTHIDALCHVMTEDQMYNGFASSEVRSFGAKKGGIDKMLGVLTKGIMLDVAAYKAVDSLEPGYVITPEDLEGAAHAQQLEISSGDAILIRTGWLNRLFAGEGPENGEPGVGRDVAKWLVEKQISVVGADNNGVEVMPSEEKDSYSPVHIALIRNRGMPLMELLNLEELHTRAIFEFLFVAVPLNITGGTGSPVRPVAIV